MYLFFLFQFLMTFFFCDFHCVRIYCISYWYIWRLKGPLTIWERYVRVILGKSISFLLNYYKFYRLLNFLREIFSWRSYFRLEFRYFVISMCHMLRLICVHTSWPRSLIKHLQTYRLVGLSPHITNTTLCGVGWISRI